MNGILHVIITCTSPTLTLVVFCVEDAPPPPPVVVVAVGEGDDGFIGLESDSLLSTDTGPVPARPLTISAKLASGDEGGNGGLLV